MRPDLSILAAAIRLMPSLAFVEFFKVAWPTENLGVALRICATKLRRNNVVKVPWRFWMLAMFRHSIPRCTAKRASFRVCCNQ